MKVEGDGFLSEESVGVSHALLEPHAEVLEKVHLLLREIQDFCKSQELTSAESNVDKQKIIALVLCVRIIEITEAALLIMRHGMTNETNSLLRIFLDAYFVFSNVCSDEDFVPQYFKSDEAARLKLMNVALSRSSELFENVREYANRERDDLAEKIKQEDIEAFQSWAYAANIGAEDIYDGMYRLASPSLHTAPRSLEVYIEEDEKHNIGLIRNYPQLDDIPELAYTFCSFLLKVYSGVTELFGRHDPEKIDQLARELDGCVR